MSPLEVLQLVGYSIGAVLPLWLAALLVSRRRKLTPLERVLFVLSLSMGAWHASNLVITLHSLFGFGYDRWTTVLRLADTVAVISITFLYSFLLHIHIHLRANASGEPLKRSDVIGIYSSYLPAVFLSIAIPRIWAGDYAPMFVKVSFFVLPFAFWAAYVLGRIAVTELLIARRSASPSEQRIMRTLAASFVAILILIFATLVLRVGEGTTLGLYLKTIGNLSSLLPSALLVYSIYRYRYLELIIEESLIVFTFAAVVLTVYLYGIRTLDGWVHARFRVRAGVIEAVLILALTLSAAPMRRWLERGFHKLFEREATLFREIVARIGSHAGQYKELPELLRFVEERTTQALGLRDARIIISDQGDSKDGKPPADGPSHDSKRSESQQWIDQILRISRDHDWAPVEDEPALTTHGYRLAYPLRREDRTAGLLVVDGPSGSLTPDARAVLGVLAGQIAIAIEDCRLVEENVRLERQLADQERLAALGQMAATVAHEIKNPLSSIKSIAQVMSEDERLSGEYARDLSLIVGETDRLSQSVTQLLSFARRDSPAEVPCRIEQLIASVVGLFRPEAEEQGITVECSIESDEELDGVAVSAVRDSLANLLLNAVQATPAGGRVIVEAKRVDGQALIAVRDGGPGIPTEIRQRIWEPFFTTKQRGTGLGLAIVRKRMEEAGGSARLAPTENGQGARFELRVPIAGV
jgi:signal transduction histidine kinase